MFQIARNSNYDYFKKHKKRRYDADINDVQEQIHEGDSIEEQLTFEEDTSNLNKALNRLAPEKKEI